MEVYIPSGRLNLRDSDAAFANVKGGLRMAPFQTLFQGLLLLSCSSLLSNLERFEWKSKL